MRRGEQVGRNKLFLPLALLLVFAGQALSIGLVMEKGVYGKGETLSFTVNCPLEGGGEKANARISLENRVIAALSADVEDGEASFSYTVSYLDPSGIWNLEAGCGGENTERDVKIEQVPSSAYYLIKFLSPTGSVKRAEDVAVNVQVTDSGTVVSDANLAAWGLRGERLLFDNLGGGKYRAIYQVPHDAGLDAWEIIVCAGRGGEGGEGRSSAMVEKAPVYVEILEPTISSFEMSVPIDIVVRAAYFNGKPIKNATVIAAVNSRAIEMEDGGEGIYRAVFRPGMEDVGGLQIEVSATDNAGNYGSAEKGIVAVGWLGWFMRNFWWLVIASVIAAVLTFTRFRFLLGKSFETARLAGEKRKHEALLKKLQDDYYSGGDVKRETFDRRVSEYKTKLKDINGRIEKLGKRKR